MRSVIFYDMVVVTELQDLYFLLNRVDFRQTAGRQYFYGVEVAGALVECLRDGPISPLA